jgi:hypothetical protein
MTKGLSRYPFRVFGHNVCCSKFLHWLDHVEMFCRMLLPERLTILTLLLSGVLRWRRWNTVMYSSTSDVFTPKNDTTSKIFGITSRAWHRARNISKVIHSRLHEWVCDMKLYFIWVNYNCGGGTVKSNKNHSHVCDVWYLYKNDQLYLIQFGWGGMQYL